MMMCNNAWHAKIYIEIIIYIGTCEAIKESCEIEAHRNFIRTGNYVDS